MADDYKFEIYVKEEIRKTILHIVNCMKKSASEK